MPFLRAFLFLSAFAAAAVAQTLPAVPPGARGSDAVMTLPIGESTSDSLPGPRPSRIRVLAPADRDLFVRTFEAGGRGDWKAARGLAAQGQNTIARRLLEWRYALDKNSGATFAEIDAVIKDTANWPLRGTLQARAETAMDPAMPPDQVIAWFTGKNPNSSIGRIRLG